MSIKYFDLHCDTLYRVYTENLSVDSDTLNITTNKAKRFDEYSQLMAVWIPDIIRGQAAFDLFKACTDVYKNRYLPLNNSKINFMLSVENGSVIGGDISNISTLKEYGVRALSLVYNDDNELGSGAFSESKFGLTSIGKKAVEVFEKNNIYIDLSHSSVRTFYDVAEISNKPIIATHSNSYSLCPHKRNLTDEQFEIIKNSGGVVGINFYPPFLNPDDSKASVNDVIKHIYHFLSLGGEDSVCIGSDFDGCDALKELDSIDKMPFLYDTLLKSGFNEQVVQKIMYKNAHNLFT
ncbi:MAG: membrane dipeptidase [Clostridia bacterium]|nr:membrane dipeptidase [Clostridia bacterium]